MDVVRGRRWLWPVVVREDQYSHGTGMIIMPVGGRKPTRDASARGHENKASATITGLSPDHRTGMYTTLEVRGRDLFA